MEIGAQADAYIEEREGFIDEGPMVERLGRVAARPLAVVRKRPEVIYAVKVLDT